VVRCAANGCVWFVDSVGNGVYNPATPTYTFGQVGDIPVVGDWGGNGHPKHIGVFRGGTWILDVNGSNVMAPNDIQGSFGQPGDIPVVGKWTL